MATSLSSRLSTLKIPQLKRIASLTGINTSGTKAVLTSRLLDELPIPKLKFEHSHGPSNEGLVSAATKDGRGRGRSRIISIDMGIRNLAYCVIDVPAPTLDDHNRSRGGTIKWEPPRVLAWRRIAIAAKGQGQRPQTPDQFSPPTLSHLAYNLITHTFLPHKATQVLIERQRFRTLGGSAIQEWTVRVNMFESMLWAVFETLRREKMTDVEVQAVLPGKVGAFWLGDEIGGRGEVMKKEGKGEEIDKKGEGALVAPRKRQLKTAKQRTKQAKIDIVGTWLSHPSDSSTIVFADGAKQTGGAFLKKWSGKRGKRKSKTPPKRVGEETEVSTEIGGGNKMVEEDEMSKLDDLADCLLQGIAWVKWEENRRRIIQDEGSLDQILKPSKT
ncbi:MAG: hypothetical protein M1819_006572 [Sarea resinae]|nr:MAG: hypothetical protein M1819_006572 [Sarea resinae]